MHVSSVLSGKGLPVASMAAPPISSVVNWNECPSFFPAASSTRRATSVISGPMPSPGSTVILWLVPPAARATTAEAARRGEEEEEEATEEAAAWRRAPATEPAPARCARKAIGERVRVGEVEVPVGFSTGGRGLERGRDCEHRAVLVGGDDGDDDEADEAASAAHERAF